MIPLKKSLAITKKQESQKKSTSTPQKTESEYLAGQSKIIIFDEPTANLDPHNSKVVANHIKEQLQSNNLLNTV